VGWSRGQENGNSKHCRSRGEARESDARVSGSCFHYMTTHAPVCATPSMSTSNASSLPMSSTITL
jgi:hypothetical protein